MGNPDFQVAVNPGNVAVSSTAAGKSTVFLSPGPGLGFFGSVSLTCAGLPTGASCSFQPSQVNLDGFTSATAALSISKAAQSAMHGTFHPGKQMAATFAVAAAGCFFLFAWPRKSRRWL